ncbi:MAG: DNA polymerase Y family protein [Erythrobacter sp.]|nr:DNA polymerase Y family protein [Erythrobacter sp.]
MAICCSELALDRWRDCENCQRGEGADALPTALIAETAHGPRVETINHAARAEGVRAGVMLADARTLCPMLQVRAADPAGDLAFLERFAVWAQRWGPWSATDPPDGVLVDVTAVAHLFGGEARLLADVAARCQARGLATSAAIAPTAGAAWALARFAADGTVLPPDDDAMARLAHLPVAALRLDADVLLVLRRLGLKRLGDLVGIERGTDGRDKLQRRFRTRRAPSANPLIRMDQLLGRVPEPLLPVVPVEAPLVQRRLLEPVRHRDLLDRVVADLAEDMARALEARGEGARRLQLGLWRVDGEVTLRELELASATRDPAHVCRLFGERLDGLDAGFGFEMLRLRASWAEPLHLAQADLEAAAEAHGTSLAMCLDRLTARLGSHAVQRPVPRASHVPERAQGWQGPFAPQPAEQGQLAFHLRPLKLLDRAEPIAVLYAAPEGYPRRFRWRGQLCEVARVEGPERIAPEWWRERGTARLRDYYRVEDALGRRYWIYRSGVAGDGRGGSPEWFMQGLFG